MRIMIFSAPETLSELIRRAINFPRIFDGIIEYLPLSLLPVYEVCVYLKDVDMAIIDLRANNSQEIAGYAERMQKPTILICTIPNGLSIPCHRNNRFVAVSEMNTKKFSREVRAQINFIEKKKIRRQESRAAVEFLIKSFVTSAKATTYN